MRGRLLRWLLLGVLVTLGAMPVEAQRRVTPVKTTEPGTRPDPSAELTKTIDPSRLVTTTDANGNTVTVDTVTGLEYVDSTLLPAPPKMVYPLVHQAIVGVNVWDGIMRALGQKFGLGDVWAEMSLHNRYFPFLAVGVGDMNDTPYEKNYTFRVRTAPYFKLGCSYNFFYNSSPDYRLQMGLRYGFSSYKWSVLDVKVDEGYWDEPSTYSLTDLSHTAGWLEVTLGIKVKIAGPVSAGWTLVYHSVVHDSKSAYGQPMYIPGYGKRNGAFTGNFSLIYTIPLNKKTRGEVNNVKN